MRLRKISLCLPWLLLGWASAALADSEVLVSRARESSGFSSLSSDRVLQVTGHGVSQGEKAEFLFMHGSDGTFRAMCRAPLSLETVFDGSEVWQRDFRSGPYPVQLSGKESLLLRAWVHSGYWLHPEAPVHLEVSSPGDLAKIVTVRCENGSLVVRVELDPTDFLPRRLRIPDGTGELVVEYADYVVVDGVTIATSIRSQLSAGHGYELSSGSAEITEWKSLSLDMPAPLDDSFVDPVMDPSVEVVMSRSKRLYVRPLINGEDVGLFLFDTGAGFTGLSASVAERLKLTAAGKTGFTGLGGEVTETRFRQASTFQLGPLSIENFWLTETPDREPFDRDMEEVVGVIGWDVLIRCLVELDPREGKVALYDFDEYSREGLDWERLWLHQHVPWIKARFTGDREGLFMVDTGAAGMPVFFFAGATRRLGLLAERQVKGTTSEGAGGSFTHTVAPLDWFEVAGDGFRDSPTVFGLGDDGEDDPATTGLIGGGLLRLYDLVFDYSRRRIAFLPE